MRRNFLLTAFLVSWLVLAAQTQHFYTSDQLSSNQITNICQDKAGYIWIGTEYGLNKYDGYRFTNYLYDKENTASIQSNNVVTLFVDLQGTLWVGTGMGLSRYNAEEDNFQRITLPGITTARVSDIIQSDDYHLLIGTAGYGLFRLDTRTCRTEQMERYANQGDNDYFSRIKIDQEGTFWKAGSGPIISYRPKGQQQTLRTYESPFGTVTSFVDYEDGLLMVCQRGLIYYRNEQFFTDFIDISVLGEENVLLRSALRDNEGNLFIGTLGKGLWWIPRGERQLQRYDYSDATFDLNTSNVWALFEDNQDNLWVGCLKRGVLLLPQRAPLFNTWKFSFQSVSIGGSVTSFCQGDNGMTWCAVQNNGIYGFDANGRMVAHPASPSNTYSIYRDHQGNYWIGTGKGLYAYNPLTGVYRKEISYDSDYINVMADDDKGHLFFSTYSKGFCSYDLKTKEVRNFNMRQTNDEKGRLHNNWVMSMMIDSKGKLWLGTSSNLCCYDPNDDTFRPYGWEVLLEGKSVTSLYENSRHQVLIGTDTGLYLYDEGKKDVVPFENGEDLTNKVVSGIVEDEFGDLWCSTSMGIWQYQKDKNRFIGYLYGNGLATREYIWGAAMKTSDNTICFGISDGITSFRPTALRSIKPWQGDVHLTGLYIGGNAVNRNTLSDGRHVIMQSLEKSDRFELSYLDNSFTMEFSLLNFSNAENVIYEYRLNGSKEWTQTMSGRNRIPFTHLQPGTYALEVRAYDNGTYTEPQVYHIIIRAPWYRSAWAYLIYILALLVLLGLLVWFYIRRRKQELDEEKMKFLINATHDIRSPLTLIMSPLHKLLKREELDPEMKGDLKTIEHNAQRVQNLVNQILDIRKIDKQQMHLHCQETDMVQYVGNLLKSYEYTAKERGMTLRYSPALDKLNVWVDRKAIDKVVDNLLSNAFKYTYDNGEIEVRVSGGEDNKAELQVIDNGMGIKGDVHKIFDRFYQGSTSRSLHIEGTGIGLNLCKMIVEMHHGTIDAVNREDTPGSIFTVRLPLGNNHLTKEEIVDKEDTEKTIKPKSYSNYRVLVVDDDAEIGEYISQELGSYYKISSVTSARDALRLLLSAEPEKQFDLVVSDVMMPEMDGFTMLRMIKTNMNISHIPVVMLTSKADVANRLEGLEKGADAFLAKPFDMDELHVVINNLISKNLRLKGKYSGVQQQKDKVEEKKVKGNDELLMERIMKVVNEHLSDSDFNVDVLTREVGISRAQLHRKMKEMTGLPVSEFIRNIRLEQAVRLLKEQKINVTQVAYTVGFSNLAHFSTVFRKQFGVSPTEYIEQNLKVETKSQ
ncbi:MAG: response regulator [Prevotella sp.]|nr:response regulator [Prevotella sp.]